jgi:hypothetical protein
MREERTKNIVTKLSGRKYLEDLGMDCRILLTLFYRGYNVRVWVEFICLNVGRKRWGISCRPERLLSSYTFCCEH